jgi:hypothetical protein
MRFLLKGIEPLVEEVAGAALGFWGRLREFLAALFHARETGAGERPVKATASRRAVRGLDWPRAPIGGRLRKDRVGCGGAAGARQGGDERLKRR